MKNQENIIDGITIQFDTSDFLKFRGIVDPRIDKTKLIIALLSIANDICIESNADIKKIFNNFLELGEDCKCQSKEEVKIEDFDRKKGW